MPGDIGPGPLMCIRSVSCPGCGAGVTEGCLYQCVGLYEISPFAFFFQGPCECGEEHPYVVLQNRSHVYCPSVFGPLGDPEAEIKETDEPLNRKRRVVKEVDYV